MMICSLALTYLSVFDSSWNVTMRWIEMVRWSFIMNLLRWIEFVLSLKIQGPWKQVIKFQSFPDIIYVIYLNLYGHAATGCAMFHAARPNLLRYKGYRAKYTEAQCWVNCQIWLVFSPFSVGKLFSVLDFHLKVTLLHCTTTARLHFFMAHIWTHIRNTLLIRSVIDDMCARESQVVFIPSFMYVPQPITNSFSLWINMLAFRCGGMHSMRVCSCKPKPIRKTKFKLESI